MVARRAGLLGAAVAVALLVTACDPAMLDPVPGFMASTEQEVNLASVIGIRYADAELHAVVRPNDETFFVLRLLSGNESGNQALWLDSGLQVRARFPNPDAEEPESDEDFPLTGPIFATTNGGVQVGRILYDPGANAISNAPTIEDAFLIYPVDQGGGTWVYRVFTRGSRTGFVLETYDSAISTVSSTVNWQWGMGDSVEAFRAGRAYDGSGMPFTWFAVAKGESSQTFARNMDDADLSFSGNLAMDQLAPIDAGDLRFDTLQSTAAGLFARRYDGVNLMQFDLGNGSRLGEADLARGQSWYGRNLRVIVDPRAEFYLVFDTSTNRMYKVSSWW